MRVHGRRKASRGKKRTAENHICRDEVRPMICGEEERKSRRNLSYRQEPKLLLRRPNRTKDEGQKKEKQL